MITLGAEGEAVIDRLELPWELLWADEFAWQSVKASAQYSLQGILHIQKSKAGSGRPITLTSQDAWITRTALETLYAKAENDETDFMVLTLHDGRSFDVTFRYWEPPAIEATPIKKMANPETDEEYILSIKLVEV